MIYYNSSGGGLGRSLCSALLLSDIHSLFNTFLDSTS